MSNRRKFLAVSGIVVGGVAVGGLQAEGVGASQASAEEEVRAVVSKYGSETSIKHTDGQAKKVAIQVRMHSHEAFAKTFSGPQGIPFERIDVSGNVMSFQHRGVDFTLENLV